MSNSKTRALVEGAIMVALATVLSYIKLFELPQGGSICLGMLPIFFFCIKAAAFGNTVIFQALSHLILMTLSNCGAGEDS